MRLPIVSESIKIIALLIFGCLIFGWSVGMLAYKATHSSAPQSGTVAGLTVNSTLTPFPSPPLHPTDLSTPSPTQPPAHMKRLTPIPQPNTRGQSETPPLSGSVQITVQDDQGQQRQVLSLNPEEAQFTIIWRSDTATTCTPRGDDVLRAPEDPKAKDYPSWLAAPLLPASGQGVFLPATTTNCQPNSLTMTLVCRGRSGQPAQLNSLTLNLHQSSQDSHSIYSSISSSIHSASNVHAQTKINITTQ
jgi:hypothetical protein